MTERGLPLADGAPACPFVAFDDDRDERASVPDHRHRCFAETHPAPRALAHQEAYCLSSAFPVCPTFQDWARREAARSRDGSRSTTPVAAVPRPTDRGSAAPAVVPPELAAAAAGAMGETGTDGASSGTGERRAEPIREAGVSPAARLLEGEEDGDSPVDDRPAPRSDGLAQRNPPRDWSAPPPWLASNEGRRPDDADPPSFLGRRIEPGQGLVGSPADRMAGGPSVPPPGPGHAADAEEEWTSAPRPPRPSRAAPPPRADVDDVEDEFEEGSRPPSRRPRAYEQHLGGPDGPDWERPRRYEAYPTIRTRVGLPRVRVPQVAVMAATIVVLAIALFFLPGILNLGGSPGPGSSSAPSSAVRPSVSVAPTIPPEPTPELYTIKKGETLSKIATAHGITLEELLAANPAIKNPNRISEGQQIIIPVPSEEPPDTVGESTAP